MRIFTTIILGIVRDVQKKPLKKRVIQLDYMKIMHWQKQNKIKKQKNKPISKSKDKLEKRFAVHIIGKGLFS